MNRIHYLLIAVIAAAIACVPPAGAQERFERGLEQISFVPKGQWITGVSVSYTQSNQDNYQFFIVEGISGDTYSFKLSPMLMYCFQDNLAAGGRFGYERSMIKVDKGSAVIDSETTYDIDNLYSIRQNFYSTLAFRNYISLGNSSRFGFYNEVGLKFGGGQSKLVNGTGADLTGTYETNFQMGIGLTPGLIMFLNNYSAIEVGVGVLGFDYTRTRSKTDQIYLANRSSKSANFKINLFSVSFGVTFYL